MNVDLWFGVMISLPCNTFIVTTNIKLRHCIFSRQHESGLLLFNLKHITSNHFLVNFVTITHNTFNCGTRIKILTCVFIFKIQHHDNNFKQHFIFFLLLVFLIVHYLLPSCITLIWCQFCGWF